MAIVINNVVVNEVTIVDETYYEYIAEGYGVDSLPVWRNYSSNEEAQALRYWAQYSGVSIDCDDADLMEEFQQLLAADAAAGKQ